MSHCRCYRSVFLAVLILCSTIISLADLTFAGDPFGTEQSPKILIGEPTDIAFDQVNWKQPQGVFTWIAMARGYDTPWASHGRAGWLTDDATVEPVDPGVSNFPPNTPEIYIVFEGQPLDAPGQFAAAWHPLSDGKKVGDEPLGKDVVELEMNQRFAYFIISPPEDTWKPGKYLVDIYYGSPGQALHAINIIGTMTFTIDKS
ncbi:MAG: hypothetical protein ACPGYT_11180 [Nitrospirales bacterium]